MTLNFCILASGSNGNCSAIWSEKTAILVDCGCSRRYIIKNLVKLGVSLSNLTAAIITHGPHKRIWAKFFCTKTGFLFTCMKKFLKMYTKNMDQKLRNVTLSIFREIFMLKTFTLNLLMFITETKIFQKLLGSFFSSTISGREYKIGYVTDTGKICNKIIKNLINSNILVIESNYNRKMLNSSFRAYENKKWVSGNWGI